MSLTQQSIQYHQYQLITPLVTPQATSAGSVVRSPGTTEDRFTELLAPPWLVGGDCVVSFNVLPVRVVAAISLAAITL